MTHFRAARPRGLAQRRVLAWFVGVLAILVATFAPTAVAGTGSSKGSQPARHHAGKHEPGANAGADANDDNQGQADDKQGQNNDNQGQNDENKPPRCDSSGEGNPCHPPQACGQNSGPGNGDDMCPPVTQGCAVDNSGHGNANDRAQGESAKGRHEKGDGHDAKGAKGKNRADGKDHAGHHRHGRAGDVEHQGDAGNCPAPPPNCAAEGKVLKDGMCVPAEECRAPDEVQDDACVPAGQCQAGQKMEDGHCVPVQACEDGKVLENGTCIPAEECKPPNMVENGECVPPPPPGCKEGEVLKDGHCVPAERCQPPDTVVNGVCQAPPANNPPANNPPANNPPANNPPANNPPANNAAPGAAATGTPVTTQAPAEQPPASAVAGTRVASASARLRTQARCGTGTFRVTISGRNLGRVTLFVAGRRVRTITVPAGRRSITVSVPVRRFGARRQSVQARVTFRNGAAPRTLTASATRCAQGAVSPQFTG